MNNTGELKQEPSGEKGPKGSMRDSIKWFKDGLLEVEQEQRVPVKPIQRLNRRAQNTDPNRFVSVRDMTPGSMYMFFYDPKTKETLPYFDQYPLIFVIDVSSKGITGLNMHYLRPTLRMRLLDALRTRLSNRNYDSNTRVMISYQTLKAASKYRYFAPCFKKYLPNHFISKVKLVHPSEWDNTIMLPNESFVGLNSTMVWKMSEGMI